MCRSASLRSALTGPFVHVPCGGIRGYVDYVGRYQSCPCEPREEWDGHDVSEKFQLCVVCAQDTAGGPSRWSWLACDTCRLQAESFPPDQAFGLTLPLGRHSIMNQRYISLADDAEHQAVATQALLQGLSLQHQLSTWRAREVRRLGAGLADNVPHSTWKQRFPGGTAVSRDALVRFHAAVLAGELA
ncbi:MAG: hypothetical protein JWM02_3378 [Frankiales bacterium]|nr:hypothetical protein [Frankiales bacterium]